MAAVRYHSKPVKEGFVQIFLDFTYAKGSRFRYFTGIVLNPMYWDKKKQSVKASRDFPQHSELNALLNKLANEAVKIQVHYQNEQQLLTKEEFKRALDVFRGKIEANGNRQTFFQFFEQFISERTANPKYAKGSIKVYQTTLNKLHDFEGHTKRKIDFPTFEFSFFADFVNFLFAQDFKTNYVDKLASTLKTVLKEAEQREAFPDFKYKRGWVKSMKEDVDAIYLNPVELDVIASLDLSNNLRLDRIRDLFLIGCHTGLRFSDYSQLRPENLVALNGGQFIKIVTQKTDQLVTIPAKQIVRAILKKYGGIPPRGLSNQKMNTYLKELGELAGIDEQVVLTTKIRGDRKQTTFPKWQLMTSHTARRSFATNAYQAKLPVKSIMLITGHKTDKEFYKYIRLNSEEHALLMAGNPFFE